MLTRITERIFHLMCFTGKVIQYVYTLQDMSICLFYVQGNILQHFSTGSYRNVDLPSPFARTEHVYIPNFPHPWM